MLKRCSKGIPEKHRMEADGGGLNAHRSSGHPQEVLYVQVFRDSCPAQLAIDLLQERRTALISAAVTGQIDVRGLAEGRTA